MSGFVERSELAGLLNEVYDRLLNRYGPQGWWPAESPFEVIVGAILTQSTAWVNVEKALASMRDKGCWSFEAIAEWPTDELAKVIRSSGYFNTKARKLQAFSRHILETYGGNLDEMFAMEVTGLRSELLLIHGIGEETADDIIVYAARKPSFVMDSYTRRIVDRMGLTPEGRSPGYRAYQALFQENLPGDTALFNEYHALLDHHAKVTCTKRQPRCLECPLVDLCPTGRESIGDDAN